MKAFLLICLMMASAIPVFAQGIDSVILKTRFAIADAKNFKVTNQTWKAYKKHQIIYSSDYFKPTVTNTTHSDLLTDSTYVKAFRKAAYKKTTKRRTAGHYILYGYLSGIIIGGIVGIVQLATGSLKILN